MTEHNLELEKMADALDKFASPLDPPPVHWIGDGDAGPDYCFECCESIVKKHNETNKNEWFVDGGWDNRRSSDSPSSCEICGITLGYSLTKEGIGQELYHFSQNKPSAPLGLETAYAIAALLYAAAWSPDPEVITEALELGRCALAAGAAS